MHSTIHSQLKTKHHHRANWPRSLPRNNMSNTDIAVLDDLLSP